MNVLSVEEVAAKLHLKPRTVRRYLRAGTLRGRRIGGRWYVGERDFQISITAQPPAMKEPGTGEALESTPSGNDAEGM